jgi:hypothetical protein
MEGQPDNIRQSDAIRHPLLHIDKLLAAGLEHTPVLDSQRSAISHCQQAATVDGFGMDTTGFAKPQ